MFKNSNLRSKRFISNPTHRIILTSLVFGSLFLTGCETNTGDNNSLKTQEMRKTLAGFKLHKGITNEQSSELKKEASTDSNSIEKIDPVYKKEDGWPVSYVTTVQKYKASGKFDTQLLLTPSSDVIYLGSVIRGDSIADGKFIEVNSGTKKQQTASYSLTGENSKIGGKFQPNLNDYRKFHNEIISQKNLQVQSVWSFEEKTITSESELNMNIAASAGYKGGVLSAKLNADLDFSDTTKKTNYLIRFMQTYYTVDLNQDKNSFLYEDIKPSDFNNYRPVYVSSIAYGRLAYMTISTSLSSQELKSALNAAINTGLASIELETDINYKKLQQETSTRITVIGGNEVFTNIDGFSKFIKNTKFSPENSGSIISYKLKFVDTNEIANIVFAYDYAVRQTKAIQGEYSVTITPYKVKNTASSVGENGEVEYNGKISGYVEQGTGQHTQETWLWQDTTAEGTSYPTHTTYDIAGSNSHTTNNQIGKFTVKKGENLVLKLNSLEEIDGGTNDPYEYVGNFENQKKGSELYNMSAVGQDWTIRTQQKGYPNEKLDFIFKVSANINYPDK